MHELRTLVDTMPSPQPGHGDVWQEIIQTLPTNAFRTLCEERRKIGLERYGQPLQYGDERDAETDLLQELLDAMAYSMKANRQNGLPILVYLKVLSIAKEVAEHMGLQSVR